MSFIEAVVNVAMSAKIADVSKEPIIIVEFVSRDDLQRFKARVYAEADMLRQTIISNDPDKMVVAGILVELKHS